ncbi:hypothetical protein ABEB36_005332 [Hypothenemus hampei]|uniref:SCP domain-containing protein n=1 Tax=Hypothenemus hampei TaxID=57062 RepID=A0ABD1EXW2_HYPHA
MLYLIFCAILLIQSAYANEYCKLCKKGTHTLCKYKEGPSVNCIEYKRPELSSSAKKYIVNIHNDIRDHIASGQETRGPLGRQPAASNMNILQWDNELAEIAQRWADQCIPITDKIQHDQCRKTSYFEVGQNVLTALTPTDQLPEIAILILNWYKQVENVLPSDIETFSGIQRGKFLIGQYTQLIWAATRFVGCGLAIFRNPNSTIDMDSQYLHRLVCNYGPRGNVIGSAVYKRGIPCSKCPYGKCDSVRTNLCMGIEEPRTFNRSKTSPTKEKPTVIVHLPIELSNNLDLHYMLQNNLTKVLNDLTQRINVYLGSREQYRNDPLEGDASFPNRINSDITILNQDDLLRNILLKHLLNSLYTNNITAIINRQMYQLENGRIIVDVCKYEIEQCQYEDEEPITDLSDTKDIVLSNNMIYRKTKGVWFHGRCRCDYVYRSNFFMKTPNFTTIIIFLSILLINHEHGQS